MELLADFGRPAEVAARYHPRNPLVDPEDNHDFVIWTFVGIIAIAALERDAAADALHWIAIMFLVFATIGWVRRRQPAGRFAWRPRAQEKPAHGGRWPALLAAAGLVVFPLLVYLSPQGYWDAATLGNGVAGGLVQTDAFLGSWQRGATIGWFALVIANYLVVAAQDGWKRWNRRLSLAAHAGLGLMLLAHAAPLATLLDREPFAIFVAAGADAVARPWFGFAGAITILCTLYEMYREWVEPAPAATAAPISPGATAAG